MDFGTRSAPKKNYEVLLTVLKESLIFLFFLRKLYPSLFESKQNLKLKISWSQISHEMSKEIQKITFLKSDKQCKERWFNHLNPFLNK